MDSKEIVCEEIKFYIEDYFHQDGENPVNEFGIDIENPYNNLFCKMARHLST